MLAKISTGIVPVIRKHSHMICVISLLVTVSSTFGAVPTADWSLSTQRYSQREKPAIVCHADGSMMLFAGRGLDGKLSDIWHMTKEFIWSPSYLSVVIAPRDSHTMEYLGNVDLYYAFGGTTDAFPGGINELWAFDGTRWTQVVDSTGVWPLPRYRHRSVHVPARGGVPEHFIVLFGTSSEGHFNDAWRFTPAIPAVPSQGTWTQLNNGKGADAPSPRYDPCCVYRAATHSVVCFGGTSATDDNNEVWELLLDTNIWRFISGTGTQVDIPSTRRLAMCSLVNDVSLTVWSGYDSNAADNAPGNRVHVMNVATGVWASYPQQNGPLARDGGMACPYPSSNGGPLLTAGLSLDSVKLNDVWRLNPTTFRYELVQQTVTLPAERSSHASVAVGQKMIILFGEGASGLLGDVWEFDTVTETWRMLSDNCPYGARMGATALARGNSIWVIGGRLASGAATLQILSFDLVENTWIEIEVASSPPGRYWHSATIVEGTNILIVGGSTDKSQRTNDMYVFEPYLHTWSKVTQVPGPFLIRRSTALLRNSYTNEVMMLGGRGIVVLKDRIKFDIVKFDNGTHSSWTAHLTYLNSTNGDAGALDRSYIRSEAAAMGSGRHYIVCGGAISTTFGVYEGDSCHHWDQVTGRNLRMPPMPLNVYFTSGLYIGRTFYVFGGNLAKSTIKQVNTYVSAVQKLRFTTPCSSFTEDDANCIHCSEGSEAPGCTPVRRGYYRARNQTAARPCPAGSYSNTTGAQGSIFCLPCSQGTYNPTEGQTACIPCPQGQQCLIGAIRPVSAATTQNASIFEQQPERPRTGLPNLPLYGVVGVWAGVVALIFFASFIEQFHYWRLAHYFMTSRELEEVHRIYNKSLKDETGRGRSRGLREGELYNALVDFGVFLQMPQQNIDDLINEELVEDVLQFFEKDGTSFLLEFHLRIVICMLFNRGVYPPIPGTGHAQHKGSDKAWDVQEVPFTFKTLDLWPARHYQFKLGEPVLTHRTRSGGMLSMWAIISVLALFALLILLFVYDNVEQTEATLPGVIVRKNISTTIQIKARTLGSDAPSQCVQPGTTTTCIAGSLAIVPPSIHVGSQSLSCTFTAPGYCEMTWRCEDCHITNATSVVNLLFGHPDWYSSETVLTVDVGTGVDTDFGITTDGQISSSIVQRVFRPSYGRVFKGQPPTEMALTALPTTWNSPRSVLLLRRLYDTGYHVTADQNSAGVGHEVTLSELPIRVGVPVRVSFALSTNYLVIQRFLKKDLVGLGSALLGVLSGTVAVALFCIHQIDIWTNWEKVKKQREEDEIRENSTAGDDDILTGIVGSPTRRPDKYKRSQAATEADALVEGGLRRRQARAIVRSVKNILELTGVDAAQLTRKQSSLAISMNRPPKKKQMDESLLVSSVREAEANSNPLYRQAQDQPSVNDGVNGNQHRASEASTNSTTDDTAVIEM